MALPADASTAHLYASKMMHKHHRAARRCTSDAQHLRHLCRLRNARLSRASAVDVRNRITQCHQPARKRVTSAYMKVALTRRALLPTSAVIQPARSAANARDVARNLRRTTVAAIMRRRFDVAMHATLLRSAMRCGQSSSSTPLIQPRLCDRRLPCANFLTHRIWWAPSANGLSPKHLATGGRSPPHDAKPSALVHPHWMLCGPAHTEQGVL